MLRRGLTRLGLTCVMGLTFFCGPALAAEITPQKRAEAREHYEGGARKFDIGKFDEAAVEFQTAYELIGDPTILYNIAKSYQLAQNPERARFFYMSYLRRMDNAPNRAEVQGRINDLNVVLQQQKNANEKPPTGILHPDAKPENARPEVKPEQPKPRPEAVKPVEQPKPRPEVVRPVEQPQPQPQPEVKAEEPATPKPPMNKVVLFKGLGFGLAGLAVAGIALGAASSALAAGASSDVQRGAQSHGQFTSALADSESRGQTFDTVQYVGWAIGGAAAVGAGVLLFLAYRPQGGGTTAIAPILSPNHGGLVVSGSF